MVDVIYVFNYYNIPFIKYNLCSECNFDLAIDFFHRFDGKCRRLTLHKIYGYRNLPVWYNYGINGWRPAPKELVSVLHWIYA